MTLNDWIDKQGIKKIAKRLNVSIFTVYAWKSKRFLPNLNRAKKIIKMSKGKITWNGIYGQT